MKCNIIITVVKKTSLYIFNPNLNAFIYTFFFVSQLTITFIGLLACYNSRKLVQFGKFILAISQSAIA